jgi:alkylation response protein AidB-like acyl-CoA dehydrogenase
MAKGSMAQEQDKEQEQELIIDTSKMSDGQRQALEIAEAAREQESEAPGFVRQLFMGTFDPTLLFPFPQQSAEDAKIGDELVQRVSNYLEQHLNPDEVDATRTIPEEVILELKRMGLFAMKIPKKYGGLGLSQVNYNRVIMAVASYCGSTAVLLSAHQSIGVPQPLKMFGTEEQKKKFLTRIAEGAISAFALTEPEVGSDPAQMSMEAVPSPDGSTYTLNGLKLWCTNGPIAELLIVMARTPSKMVDGKEKKQITAFVVDAATPGIETIHRCDFMGIRGIQNGLIKFTNVKVPAENIVWGKGRGLALALRTLNTGRLTVPAACAGMAKQCLSIARRWGKQRVQWGQPVALHEAGADKVATIASLTLALEAVTWLTSHWADQGDIDIRSEAAMAKLFASEASWEIANLTLQLRGGRGYEKAASLKARGEDPFPVERMVRDSRINTIIEGTSDIMRLFLAREALDPHLRLAANLLKKNSSMGAKMKTAARMAGFYSLWYPKQWLKSLRSGSYSELGPLSVHFRFVDHYSHKLARTLFHKMVRYQASLEKRQLVLAHLVDIGMELFVMASICSYATLLHQQRHGDKTPLELADYFCNQARERVIRNFEALSQSHTREARKIAKATVDGDLRWLEEGIVTIGKN